MKKRIQDIWIKDVRADETLSKAAKHLALALYQYSDNDTGKCYPSAQRIEDDWGIAGKAFRKGKDELVSTSYITYVKGNSSKANEYQLLIGVKRDLSIGAKRHLSLVSKDTTNYSSSSYITTLKDRVEGMEEGIAKQVLIDHPELKEPF